MSTNFEDSIKKIPKEELDGAAFSASFSARKEDPRQALKEKRAQRLRQIEIEEEIERLKERKKLEENINRKKRILENSKSRSKSKHNREYSLGGPRSKGGSSTVLEAVTLTN